MGIIIIKGNFTVETDYAFVNNFKQPIGTLEIEIPEIQPFRVNRILKIKRITQKDRKKN